MRWRPSVVPALLLYLRRRERAETTHRRVHRAGLGTENRVLQHWSDRWVAEWHSLRVHRIRSTFVLLLAACPTGADGRESSSDDPEPQPSSGESVADESSTGEWSSTSTDASGDTHAGTSSDAESEETGGGTSSGGATSSDASALSCLQGLEDLSVAESRDIVDLSCAPSSRPEIARTYEANSSGYVVFSTEGTGDPHDECDALDLAVLAGDCEGEEIACEQEYHYFDDHLYRDVAVWLDAHEIVTMLLEGSPSSFFEPCNVAATQVTCPRILSGALPSSLAIPAGHRLVRGSCAPMGLAQQSSLRWVAPTAGTYRFQLAAPGGNTPPATIVVLEDSCRGIELGCTTAPGTGSAEDPLSVTVTVDAGQPVVLIVELNVPRTGSEARVEVDVDLEQ